MLLLYCKETNNYFAIHNANGTANHVSNAGHSTLKKYSYYLGGLSYLNVHTKATIIQFKKHLAKGILKNVPLEDTETVLRTKYPEYFI